MKVKCPGCDRAYKVDDNRIPQNGLVMRCPRCSQSFRIHQDNSIEPVKSAASKEAKKKAIKPPATIQSKQPSPPKPPPPPPIRTKIGVAAPNAPLTTPLDVDLPALKNDNDDPFGEFDLSSSNGENIDLPAPVGAPKGKHNDSQKVDLGATEELNDHTSKQFTRRNSDPFGSIDLSDSSVDLPAPVGGSNSPGFSDNIDLPVPVGKMALGASEFSFDDAPNNPLDIVDLPAPSHSNQLQQFDTGDIDLPAPAGWTGESSVSSSDTSDFADIQLNSNPPLPSRPEPQRAPSSPEKGRDTFGEIDFGEIGSEVRQDQLSAPMPPTTPSSSGASGSGPGRPQSPPSVGSDPFAGLDDMFAGPPEAIPSPADTIGLASSDGGIGDAFDLPPLGSSVIPDPPTHSSSPPLPGLPEPGLPVPVGSGFDAPLGSGFDMQPVNLADTPAPGLPVPVPTSGGLDDEFRFSLPEVQRASADMGEFAGLSLGSAHENRPGNEASEFDAFPTSNPPKADSTAPREASGLDLDTTPYEGDIVDGPISIDHSTEKKPTKVFEGRRKHERRSRLTKIIVLASLLGVLLIGTGLTWTPLGAFGTAALAKLIPNTKTNEIINLCVTSSEKALGKDTLASANQAISEFQISLNEIPNNEDIRLYGAYLYHWIQIRFGVDKSKDQAAAKLLEGIILDESESPFAPLAKSAQDLRMGKAESSAIGITGPTKEMKGGLALLVNAQLSNEKFKDALNTANSFLAKEKSPRAAHLLAQATSKASPLPIALKKLEELSASYSNHPGIKLLLAEKLLASRPLQGDRIIELTQSIGEETPPEEKAQAHALRGHVYFIERKLDKASEEFDAAEKLVPDNIDMLLGKGNIHLLNSDWASAASLFNKASSIDPKNLEAALGKAAIQLGERHLTESKEVLSRLAMKNPQNPRVHYLLGRAQFALKKEKEAKVELEKAIELDKQFLEPYITLSELHLAAGRDEDAMKALDAASEAAPGSPLINHALAQAHASRGDLASAIVELNKAVDLDPDNLRSHYLLSQMHQSMGSLDDAAKSLDEIKKRNPDYPGLAISRGRLLEKRGKTERALRAYEKALADSPDDPLAKIAIGATSLKLKDYKRAEQLLSEALSQLPKSAEANFFLGEVYRETQRFPESAPLLKRSVDLDKGKAVYHLRYAQTLMANKDGVRAMKELEKAQRLAPKLAETYVRMGQLRLRQGSPKDAIEFLDKGLSLDPQFAEAYGLVAEAFEQLSDLRSSVAYYKRAVQAIPGSADLFFKYSLVELRVHGQRAAIAPLSNAVRLADAMDPKPYWFPEALYRLGSVQAAAGSRANAITAFKRYLEIAPPEHIDRADALGQLDRLGLR